MPGREIRADDFQRVNFAFRRINLLLALLFRKSQSQKSTRKLADFGDELVTSFGLAAQRDDDASTALWIGLIRQRQFSRIEVVTAIPIACGATTAARCPRTSSH
jgi:hypothetical protein